MIAPREPTQHDRDQEDRHLQRHLSSGWACIPETPRRPLRSIGCSASPLQSPDDHHHMQEDEHEAENADRSVAPGTAVRSGGNRAYQHEQHDDQQDCPEAHGAHSFLMATVSGRCCRQRRHAHLPGAPNVPPWVGASPCATEPSPCERVPRPCAWRSTRPPPAGDGDRGVATVWMPSRAPPHRQGAKRLAC